MRPQERKRDRETEAETETDSQRHRKPEIGAQPERCERESARKRERS